MRADVLARVGGFPDPVHGEDTALVQLLDADPDVTVTRTEQPVVLTSSRLSGRAAGGLADLLRELDADAEARVPVPTTDAAFAT